MSEFVVSEEAREELASYIKNIREEKKIGLNQLALKAGIQKTILSRLESGKILKINPFFLKQLAEALNKDYKVLYKIVGYLDKDTEEDRSNVVRITTKKVPLYGSASAGPGYINLSEEIEEFSIPIEDYKPGRFVVRVKGDSMTGPLRSIPDGTVALVDPSMCTDTETLINKVCIFTYNDETYVKQFVMNNQKIIQLVSFNPEVETIIVLQPKELKCEGRVVKTWSEQSW